MSRTHHWILITSSIQPPRLTGKTTSKYSFCTSVLGRLYISNSNPASVLAVPANVSVWVRCLYCLGRIIRHLGLILKNNQPILRRWLSVCVLALAVMEQWPHVLLDSAGNEVPSWLGAMAGVNHHGMHHCPLVPNTVYLQENKGFGGLWLLPRDCKIGEL